EADTTSSIEAGDGTGIVSVEDIAAVSSAVDAGGVDTIIQGTGCSSMPASSVMLPKIIGSQQTTAGVIDDGKPRILSNIIINGANTGSMINPLVKKELIMKVSNNLNKQQQQETVTMQSAAPQSSGTELSASDGGAVDNEQSIGGDGAASNTMTKATEKDNSFIVTPDYIQETIKTALKQENLNPEITEKLLNLQRYQEKQMRTEDRPDRTIALQHNYSNMSGVSRGESHAHAGGNRVRKRTARTDDDDDEWQLDTPKRARPSKAGGSGVGQLHSPHGSDYGGRERKYSGNETPSTPAKRRTIATGHTVTTSALTPCKSPTSTISVAVAGGDVGASGNKRSSDTHSPATSPSPLGRISKGTEKRKTTPVASPHTTTTVTATNTNTEVSPQQIVSHTASLRQSKSQAQLNRHKEQLKKVILKKRSHLEKELQVEIQKELTVELQSATTTAVSAVRAASATTISSAAVYSDQQQSPNDVQQQHQQQRQLQPFDMPQQQLSSSRRQTAIASAAKLQEDAGDDGGADLLLTPPGASGSKQATDKSSIISTSTRRKTIATGTTNSALSKEHTAVGSGRKSQKHSTPAGSKGHRSAGGRGAAGGQARKGSKKNNKMHCICQTPYDKSKFYVGCDLCNNWFHGDCVGISEEKSKAITEYVCDECKHARETQELYCLCRRPYDETQFYICCDKCQDWFHGRCVGILQSEAEYIDEYICPNCQINNSVNFANMKPLSTKEFENLKELIMQIQQHKSAWPFMEPVDQNEAPDYYRVIKEPMDLRKIESKIESRSYQMLSEFIGDMTKIFDNCRFYNPKESPFFRCAESLESFFVAKIKFFRENLVDKKEDGGTDAGDGAMTATATTIG
uniref:Bromodomain-containing protein n=2 Tax=Anopheles albimanus TaxID=7167 RepID=A0A182FGM5_ANOAL